MQRIDITIVPDIRAITQCKMISDAGIYVSIQVANSGIHISIEYSVTTRCYTVHNVHIISCFIDDQFTIMTK